MNMKIDGHLTVKETKEVVKENVEGTKVTIQTPVSLGLTAGMGPFKLTLADEQTTLDDVKVNKDVCPKCGMENQY